MFRVNFHKFDLCVSSICIICGVPFVMEHVEAALWEGNKFIGNMCQECIRKGSQDFTKILQQQAQQLNDKVKIIEELIGQEISCPPWEEYQRALPAEKRDITDKQKGFQELRQMTMSRILLIGEEIIPKEEVEGLKSKQINIFLTEPDLDKWPSEISHLKRYVDMELDIQTFLKPDET